MSNNAVKEKSGKKRKTHGNSYFQNHEDVHKDTVFVCPHCGLQLCSEITLKRHMVVHSDQKKFKCHYCGKEYKRSKTLKIHLILHTGMSFSLVI